MPPTIARTSAPLVALNNAQSILVTRQKAEQALLAAQREVEAKATELAHLLAMTQATLESTTDGILVTDNAERVTDLNTRYVSMWGLSPEIVSTRDHRRILDATSSLMADPAAFLAGVADIYRSAPAERHDLLAHRRPVHRALHQDPDVAGLDVGRLWSFRDITDRRRGEQDHAYSLRSSLVDGCHRQQTMDGIIHELERRRGADLRATPRPSDRPTHRNHHSPRSTGRGRAILERLAGRADRALRAIGTPRTAAHQHLARIRQAQRRGPNHRRVEDRARRHRASRAPGTASRRRGVRDGGRAAQGTSSWTVSHELGRLHAILGWTQILRGPKAGRREGPARPRGDRAERARPGAGDSRTSSTSRASSRGKAAPTVRRSCR